MSLTVIHDTRKEVIVNVRQILEKVNDILDTEERWHQGDDAFNEDEGPVEAISLSAQQWCLRGAIIRATYECNLKGYESLNARNQATEVIREILRLNRTECTFGGGDNYDLVGYNDQVGRSFEDIKLTLKKAIAIAPEEELPRDYYGSA